VGVSGGVLAVVPRGDGVVGVRPGRAEYVGA